MNVSTVQPTLSLLTVGDDAEFATTVTTASAAAFPEVKLQSLPSVAEALARPGQPAELLILFEPTAEELGQAVGGRDLSGLPRWAVVVLGEAPRVSGFPASQALPREEWNTPAIGRVLRAALENHELAKENARLRGDLLTFGHRIAHDLRTPLGGITTTAEMLREIVAETNPEDAQLAQPILDSADELVKLIERMSFVAKLPAGREVPRRFSMEQAFWDAFQQIEGAALKAGATIAPLPREWPEVMGRPAWLQVVWRNLLQNALRFGGPGGTIAVGWSDEGGEYRFFVRHGGTVPEEKRALLFFPFERLHEMGAPRGLGLAIVRRLVELEGGRCGFDVPGEGGTEYYFTLPSLAN